MPKASVTRLIERDKKTLINFVLDIEKYPEFIPFCINSKVYKKKEVEDSKKLFKKNNWPVIDVTRRSVEETAASILKIIDIKRNK